MSREKNIAIVESYLACFASKDLSNVPFAEGVVFEGPTWPALTGRQAVLGFMRMILPDIRSAQIKQHIVEGDHVHAFFYPRQPAGR